MSRLFLEKRGAKFYYAKLEGERPLLIYVDRSFVKKDVYGNYYVGFPLIGCDLIKIEGDNSYHLIKGDKNLFTSVVPTYPGEVDIIAVEPKDAEVFKFTTKSTTKKDSFTGVLVLSKNLEIKVVWCRRYLDGERKWMDILDEYGMFTRTSYNQE